jgi:hypothetical protein
VHEYIRESLQKGKVLAFSADTMDPKNQARQARKAHEELFVESSDYIADLMAAFENQWYMECAEE